MFALLREVNIVMKRSNVKCPICGHMNEDVDLEETAGWVECSKCETVFMAPHDSQHLFSQKLTLNNPLSRIPDAVNA